MPLSSPVGVPRSESTPSPLFDKIVGILSGYLGEATSRASVRMYLRALSLEPKNLEPRHIPALCEKLRPGLRVFVGGTKAEMITHLIRQIAKTEVA